jgi:hypothetical protein
MGCITYLHEIKCPWNFYTTSNIAYKGSLLCLQYVHKNGCPWDNTTCTSAARKGNIDCLMYAHKFGCKWTKDTSINAAFFGHLDCLKYCHENGCPWTEDVYYSACEFGHILCIVYFLKHYKMKIIKININKVFRFQVIHALKTKKITLLDLKNNWGAWLEYMDDHSEWSPYLKAGNIITKYALKSYYDPSYMMCRKRILNWD